MKKQCNSIYFKKNVNWLIQLKGFFNPIACSGSSPFAQSTSILAARLWVFASLQTSFSPNTIPALFRAINWGAPFDEPQEGPSMDNPPSAGPNPKNEVPSNRKFVCLLPKAVSSCPACIQRLLAPGVVRTNNFRFATRWCWGESRGRNAAASTACFPHVGTGIGCEHFCSGRSGQESVEADNHDAVDRSFGQWQHWAKEYQWFGCYLLQAIKTVFLQEKQTKRQPRSVAPSEYESLNEDFISEYDALNLDFSLDDGAKEAKPIEVPAQDLLGQNTQKLPELPPKEWWDDEEELAEGTTTKMPNKEKRPVLKASKLLAANERPKERRRELPLFVEEDRIDLPPKNGGKVCGKWKYFKI